jgi:hypothetical protein
MKQSDSSMLEVKRRVKRISETRDETYGETSGETCKRKMKNVSKPTGYIHSTWQIVTLAPSEPLNFSKEKKHSHCHRLR